MADLLSVLTAFDDASDDIATAKEAMKDLRERQAAAKADLLHAAATGANPALAESAQAVMRVEGEIDEKTGTKEDEPDAKTLKALQVLAKARSAAFRAAGKSGDAAATSAAEADLSEAEFDLGEVKLDIRGLKKALKAFEKTFFAACRGAV